MKNFFGCCNDESIACHSEVNSNKYITTQQQHLIDAAEFEAWCSTKMDVQSETVFTTDTDTALHDHGHGADVAQLYSESKSGPTTDEQTVEFVDEDLGTVSIFDPVSDSSFYSDIQPAGDLSTFLSRPVLIKTYTWNQGGFLFDTFSPWHLFFNDIRVKKKIDNFAYINCTLNIKVVVNSSPFYYGALLMNYQPLPALTSNHAPTAGPDSRIPFSQRPHVYIYPQTNSGGEMTLPFFHNVNWLDLTSAQALTNMGLMTLQEFVQLKSANGATSNGVTFQIYAWASNVKITGPTVKLAVQSKDEYGLGVISAPATALSRISGYLAKVPIVGRYARATQIGSGAVSEIAQLFGWTNVPVIADTMSYKNEAFHNLSSAHISEPTTKYTLDPKGELTIDPRVSGLGGQDELAIPYIVQKDSFISESTWSTATAVDTLLFKANVTPSLQLRSAATLAGTRRVAFTPMGHCSMLFDAWRGDIIYRFKFICSKYHKGRVRITWDPVGAIVADANSTNVTFTKIVDIGEDTDVEVRIPYLQAIAWLRTTSNVTQGTVSPAWQTTAFVDSYLSMFHNGTITVRVLNELSSPTDSSDISMLTYVRGAENMEFSNPLDIQPTYSYFAVQSQTVHDAGVVKNEHKDRFLLNFGESINSLRLLMRRSNVVDISHMPITSTDVLARVNYSFHKYPPSPGFDPNGRDLAFGLEVPASQFRYSYTSMLPYNWMQGCFIGQRGGMRWNFNLDTTGTSLIGSLSCARSVRPHTSTPYSVSPATTLTSSGVARLGFSRNLIFGGAGSAGVALTNQNTQTGLSGELAMINRYRFVSADPINNILGTVDDDTANESFQLTYWVKPTANPISNIILHRYAAIGTDFSFLFYLNAPTMFLNDTAVSPGTT